MPSPSRNQQPSSGKFIVAAGMIGAGIACYYRYPSVAIVWLGFLVAAWMEPPAIMTGKKDRHGFPSPAHPGEEKNLRRSRFYQHLKLRLIFPNSAWLPGWPPLGAWFFALLTAGAAALIPVSESIPYSPAINAAAAFITCATVLAARRSNMPEGDDCPGARVHHINAALLHSRGAVWILGGTLAGVAGAIALLRYNPTDGPWHVEHQYLAAACVLVLTIGLAVAHPWKTTALEKWRLLADVRETWNPRWEGLKIDPPPMLVDHYEVGQATVDEFIAPTPPGARAILSMLPKLAPAIGTGVKPAILEMPNVDRKNQPVPGTIHPTKFKVVCWPSDDMPNMTDPATTAEVAELYAQSAFTWVTESLGWGRPVLVSVNRISTEQPPPAPEPTGWAKKRRGRSRRNNRQPVDDIANIDEIEVFDDEDDPDNATETTDQAAQEPESPEASATAAWSSQWAFPEGPSLEDVRKQLLDQLPGSFGCEVLISHRSNILFFGDLTSGETEFAEGDNAAGALRDIATEDKWRGVWSNTLKQDANPPTVQPNTYKEETLGESQARGAQKPVTVSQVGFVTLMGISPDEYRGLESKISTALSAAPFVAVIGWPSEDGVPGARHPQAFRVVWSDGPVPDSPAGLPSGGASKLVLAGQINKSFAAVKFPYPEVASSRILTSNKSNGHIWEVILRLHNGVTLADVRAKADKIQRGLNAEWMRISPHKVGCSIHVGAPPSEVILARPKRDMKRIEQLDWSQAFLESKITGNNGLLPELTDVGTLPHNEQVQVLDFHLPPGLDLTRVRANVGKLKNATGNDYLEPSEGVNGASSIRVLASAENPLPTYAPFDFDAIDANDNIVFATGVEGEPVEFDISDNPHILVAGKTGSGKSVAAQAFLYGAAVKGADVYVIDPVKGGADFQFVEPYSRAFAATPAEAATVLKTVYGEVTRRKKANASAGVGSYTDLDDPPPPIFVMIDEFTSLMGSSPVPKQSDDPQVDAEREALIADNDARAKVGMLAGKLAREARSAGVTLILGTQKLSAKMLDQVPNSSDLKTNLARILLGKASSGDRMSALASFDDAPVLEGDIPKGRGLFEPMTSSAITIQSWYAPQKELSAALAERVEPVPDEEKIALSAGDEQEKNDAAGEGRNEQTAGEEKSAGEDASIDLGGFVFSLDEEDDSGDEPGSSSPTEPGEPEAGDAALVKEPPADDLATDDDEGDMPAVLDESHENDRPDPLDEPELDDLDDSDAQDDGDPFAVPAPRSTPRKPVPRAADDWWDDEVEDDEDDMVSVGSGHSDDNDDDDPFA